MLRLLVPGLLFINSVLAIGQQATINFDGQGHPLTEKGASVQILVDASDFPGVLRVCDDLALDFGRVTGINGSVVHQGNASGSSEDHSVIQNVIGSAFGMTSDAPSGGNIISGTIGRSSIIDGLIAEGKIDVGAINGTWEAYVSTLVQDPLPGLSQAMVVAGSDRRGTMYALYSISEQIGVSPWYWWADSPPQKHDSIHASDITITQQSPSVKYRGLFINDEAPALTGYLDAKYPRGEYGPAFRREFYQSVFELLLRLRANYLWPAMWNSMFTVDDPLNQALADEYGIVMGTSHTEPMMRATKEWNEFGDGPWQWDTNNGSIYPFFEEGAERSKPYEVILTVAMRGSHDTPISDNIETELLENVVSAQTEILTRIWGNESVRDPNIVPQTWCLYKEVQGYYEAGMNVDEYITLLWADDNWGNMRRLPVGNEIDRSGGAGVYYHFDYVGDPRNYKWINTVQLQKTWEQMTLAYERDARRIWIVNVGDIKPKELPISQFFDMAYDVSLWNSTDSVPSYLELWAAREFGQGFAKETATLMNNYSIAAGRRKYELVDSNTYSIINFNEADRILDEWKTMATFAKAIMEGLPAETKPAFFEMVYHPVTAAYVFHDIVISTKRNNRYARQGRTSANSIAQHVRDQFMRDRTLTEEYHSLLGGKWNHMMDQTHIGYEYWQQPMRNVLPALNFIMPTERSLVGDMGVSVEGNNASVPGDDMYHDLSSSTLTMSPFDPYGASTQWIDIYSVGASPFDWTITSNASFVTFSRLSGHITPSSNNTDVRVYATFDWAACPEGDGTVLVNVSSNTPNSTLYLNQNTYGTQYSMPQLHLPYNHTILPANFTTGHVESSRYISLELEHYTRITNPSLHAHYETIPGLSRTLSGITLFPLTGPSLSPSTGPALEYALYTFSPTSSTSTVNITIVTTSSLNTDPNRPLQFALQLDSQPIQEVQYVIDQPDGQNPVDWEDTVANNCWKKMTTWEYEGPGEHILRLWALEQGVVFNTAWVDLGGLEGKESYLGPRESFRVGS